MTCYLCQSPHFAARKGAVRDDPSLRILECTACGLVMLSSFEHIRPGHYAESGMHGDSPPPVEVWRRESQPDDRRRVEMLKTLLVNRRVLDFGCGAGGFLLEAEPVAASVAGVEPERRVRQSWRGGATLYSSLEEAPGAFDIITAFHVIEHLPDPRAVLKQLGARLAEGGSLVVEVPNADDALLTLYANDAFQRFTYWSQHLFYFNAYTFQLLASQAGLRVVSQQQVQRYPLSNHLHWLSQGKPGGHSRWSFLDSPALEQAYAASLAAVGKCDTLIARLQKA